MGKSDRPEIIEGVNLRNAPVNELGVVYLFAELAKRWRIRVDEIKPGFPDCIAYQRVHSGERRIRIEFEYKSRSFRAHGHRARDCDWVVCWEHNWPDAPRSLNIIELRREFGLGFNVWLMPAVATYDSTLAAGRVVDWTVPGQAHKNDLVLLYINRPLGAIRHIYKLRERAEARRGGRSGRYDFWARISRVCTLASPVFYEDLCEHRILSTAPFLRQQIRRRSSVTEFWPHLYRLVTERNREARRALKQYAPEHLR